MHSPRVGLFVALLTMSAAADAEPSAQETRTSAGQTRPEGHEVRADDLALGKPAEPPAEASAPPNDSSAPPLIVAPELSQSATVSRPSPPVPAPEASSAEDVAAGESEAGPKQLPYQGEESMPGYELKEQRRTWMVAVGGGLFGIGYAIGIGVAADKGFENGLGFTAIPVVGPWVAMNAHDDVCPGDSSCDPDEPLAGAGVLQGIGAVLLGIGLSATRQVWVRNDLAWSVTPLPGHGRSGLQLSGTF